MQSSLVLHYEIMSLECIFQASWKIWSNQVKIDAVNNKNMVHVIKDLQCEDLSCPDALFILHDMTKIAL